VGVVEIKLAGEFIVFLIKCTAGDEYPYCHIERV
jgi:hypothetical protein